MAKKTTEHFVIWDITDDCLLDSDVYGDMKDAISWGKDIVNDADEDSDITLTICKLVPVVKISKPARPYPVVEFLEKR